jgi:hypothetical protein
MSSIRKSVDIGRLSKAVQRPGVDPRVWLALASVKELGFDPEHGCFADVYMHPDENVETCYIDTPYAGSVEGVGFGDWAGIEVGDTVLVAVPQGDTNTGPLIIGRFWNAGDKPPLQITDDGTTPTKDRWIIVKPGQALHLHCTLLGLIAGGGTAVDQTPAGFDLLSQLPAGAQKSTLHHDPAGFSRGADTLLPVPATLKEVGTASTWALTATQASVPPKTMTVALAPDGFVMGDPIAAHALARADKVVTAFNDVTTAFSAFVAAVTAIGATPLTGTSLAAAMSSLTTAVTQISAQVTDIPVSKAKAE